jgi:hypothetical protein
LVAAAGLLWLGLAGCGGASDPTVPSGAIVSAVASAPMSAATGPVVSSSPAASSHASAPGTSRSVGPTAAESSGRSSGSSPTGTLTPPPAATPFAFPARYRAPSPAQLADIDDAYQSFLTDVAGLDASFDPGWVSRLREVATPKLVDAVRKVAAAYQTLDDHTVGALHDSHVTIRVQGTRAAVIDCLDEYDWYIVDNKTGMADPGATRGDFEAFTDVAQSSQGWKVSLWKPGQYSCQY